ncbi:MAG TPA: ABC transporter ATP-binding protein [Gaiellaceae bacterium]|nr:ABC transporter ATP-binding protein [Gaiellaceae bacterium]
MTAAISVRGLRVTRGGRQVLRGLDLEVEAGRVTGLLGPSGSGKTTLIRSIVGTQIVAGGSVSVLGLPAGARSLRRRVGYMTQAPSVYEDLTVHENLAYFARIVGVGADRVSRVVERVGLAANRDQVVVTLSGGERARVSLGAAILNEPEVLVLDEPTVGLDPVLRRDLWSFFHELAESGTTLLVSSHVMDEAARCDRLVLLREGSILADATPDDLLSRTGTDDLDEAFLELVQRGTA